MAVSPGKLALAGLGVLLTWSGIRGASITGSIRDLINGKAPASAGANPIVGTPAAIANASGTGDTEGNAGPVDSNSIATQALGYVGTPYVWGGANPPVGSDCSGLCNAIIGRNLHMAIPGHANGKFSGHGPTTGLWFVWTGCTTVPLSNAQPGDLIVWLTHMGIYVGGGEMVSSLNPKLGTLKSSITSVAPPGEPMRVRRLK